MIICPNCGAENLFDGATQCKKCLSQLPATVSGRTDQGDKPAYASTPSGYSNNGENAQSQSAAKGPDFEIQEVQFDSGPSNVTLGQPEEHGLTPRTQSDEPTVPETIEKEMTLYRDDELQVRMEQTEQGPAITLTNRADFRETDSENIQQSETIIPALNEKDLLPTNSEEQHTVTKKILLHPNLDKVGAPKKSSIESSEIAFETKPKTDSGYPDIIPEIKPDKHTSELIDKISGEQFRPKSVVFFKNNSIKLSGVRLARGELININGKEFELREQTAAKWPLYIGIAAGVLFLAMLVVYIVGGLSISTGQVVGVIKDPRTGQLLTGVTVTIKELNKNVQISPAGFFIFDNIPEGIYTIEAQPPGYPPISDRLTVIKNLTSTASFSLDIPDIIPPKENIMTQDIPETNVQTETATGLIKVAVSPREARVFMDGKYIGQGNQNFKASPGSHRLVIKANGYDDRIEDIELGDNSTKTINFTLNKKPIDPSQIKKTSLQLAQDLESSGKFNEALQKYNEVLKKEPNNVDCLFGQARCYLAKGDNGQALSSYLQAARAAGDKGDVPTQLEALSGVLEINPNYLTALYSRGSIFLNQGNYQQAAQDFSKVIEIDSRHLNAHYKLADAFFKSQDYAAALQTYEKTSKLNFTDPKPIAYMAQTYLAMGDLKNVKKYYEKFEKSADAATRSRFNSDPEWQRVKAAIGK
jgi:Tfp pilus assembly protein PilF